MFEHAATEKDREQEKNKNVPTTKFSKIKRSLLKVKLIKQKYGFFFCPVNKEANKIDYVEKKFISQHSTFEKLFSAIKDVMVIGLSDLFLGMKPEVPNGKGMGNDLP